MKEIETLCNKFGSLFIIDEVQTGIGRTGTLFAYEQVGIEPDIVTVAKALGNGIPVGAMIGGKELGTSFTAGSHGSTFGGNYIAMAAAKEVLQVSKTIVLKEVQEKGEYVLEKLQEELQHVECIQNIRGKGLMIGIECKHEVASFIEQLENEGLLVLQAGPNVIRLLPPLIVTNEELEQAVYIIKSSLYKTYQSYKGSFMSTVQVPKLNTKDLLTLEELTKEEIISLIEFAIYLKE